MVELRVCSKIISLFDVGVVASVGSETICRTALEYMAMGKPAVVTSIPAIKAYYDSNSVMYYEPDDEHDLARCVLELFRNPEKRAKLAAAGSASYQQYRWSVIKYEYLRVYDKLTGEKSSALSRENQNVNS